MQTYTLRKILYFLIILCGIFPILTQAATVYFDTPSQDVGTSGTFPVNIVITADKPINALSLTIHLPDSVTVTDISDGNSIINFWVDKPVYNKADNSVVFSGITPGGFSGTAGKLIQLTLLAKEPGSFALRFDQSQSKAYLNSPDAIKDTLTFKDLTLTVEAGKQNAEEQIVDTTPPEDFAVQITRNALGFENKWVAVFATQDKGSGVDNYQAAETLWPVSNYDKLNWQSADSPYVLKDQNLHSYLYIKATDKKGNERIVVVPPKYPLSWFKAHLQYIIIGIGILILILFLRIYGLLYRLRKKL